MNSTIIIGLGNPGSGYESTRHNAGFMFVDNLATKLNIGFNSLSKVNALVAKSNNWLLIKPQTFMNESGLAVSQLLNFYKLAIADVGESLFIAYDDLDLPLGTYKIDWAKSPKVHNGINSVIGHLKSTDFYHIRIGVDGRQGNRTIPGHAYVLQKPQVEEMAELQAVINNATVDLQENYV